MVLIYFIILQFIYNGVPYLNNDQVNFKFCLFFCFTSIPYRVLVNCNSLAKVAKPATCSYKIADNF